MRASLFAALTLALLVPVLVAAQGVPQAKIDTYGLKIDGRNVEVLFRVTDRVTARDLQNLQPSDLKLVEDGAPIASQAKLTPFRTDAANPVNTVELKPSANGAAPVKGSKPVALSVVGATIGLVYDASKLTNVARDPIDYVGRGRELLVEFLNAGRPIAASNPESLGLFLPLSVPAINGEQIRPESLPDFGQDRNAVINGLNQLQPRPGKTNIFDTLSVAVSATADAAASRGTDAYVLVVTDGGDSTSVGSYDALVADALARKVKLLIFGVGPQKRLATNAAALTTLAAKTGGAYVGNPDNAAAKDFYLANVSVTGQSAYILSYTTDLIDDGAPHNLVIRVDGSATGESDAIPVEPGAATGAASGPLDLGTALRGYAMRAIPLAIVVSIALTGLLVLLRRMSDGPSSSLSGGITRR